MRPRFIGEELRVWCAFAVFPWQLWFLFQNLKELTVRDMILYLNVGIYIHGKQPHFDVKAMVFNWIWHIPSIYQ